METTTMSGMGTSGMMTGMMPNMGSMNMSNMMMVPRCTMTMSKCDGGMMMTCTSTDQMAIGMMQNLCSMMSGGMTSMCMMMNGMMVMNCNMMMGMCKFEMTGEGMMMTCTSGDAMMCQMIQSCCDCMMTMMNCGCTCYLCMNNMPVCCG
ncbi:hypothetical protein IAD21_01639 [Abditibacteriota bacterium]|nr:hypothetical protein IAD21_01639 [Abditibacteriota bacterium]